MTIVLINYFNRYVKLKNILDASDCFRTCKKNYYIPVSIVLFFQAVNNQIVIADVSTRFIIVLRYL